MARFKRETQVLASLNHPNIAAIYGFEESVQEALVPPHLQRVEVVGGNPALAQPLEQVIAKRRRNLLTIAIFMCS